MTVHIISSVLLRKPFLLSHVSLQPLPWISAPLMAELPEALSECLCFLVSPSLLNPFCPELALSQLLGHCSWLPGLPGAPQDDAGLMRKFEMSHVGGATGRTPPIPRSALEKDPMPGHLFEGNPVGEGTTRRGTDTPVHAGKD